VQRIVNTHPIGKTGLQVTELGFGAAQIGNLYRAIDDDTAQDALEAAWESGFRYFDTAPYYGHGLSEHRLGRFLRGIDRNSYVLETKVGRLLVPTADEPDSTTGFASPLPFNPVYDYSYAGVMRSYEHSLHRLGVHRIDILLVHDIGELTHGVEGNRRHMSGFLDGGVKALEELKSNGNIAAWGLGIKETDICLQVLGHAHPDCFMLAGRYTLLEQSDAKPLLSQCLQRNVSIIVAGAYNSGILARGAKPGAMYEYGPAPDDILTRVAKLEDACAQFDVPLSTAALQFPLRHPAVSSVVVGGRTREQVEGNLQNLNAVIPEELWEALKDV
jgi:D-threo-aldose 1-dehydrogenase